jgi:alpha-mannosidase
MNEGPNENYKEKFINSWKGVVLFSEHTWGALQSKSDPDGEVTKKLWKVKKGYGQKAADITGELLEISLGTASDLIDEFRIINTLSWARTELVKLPADLNFIGTRLFDENKKEVPTQILSTGELAFVAENVPAFGSCVYTLKKGGWKGKNQVEVSELYLNNGLLEVKLDQKTGDIQSLTHTGSSTNFIAHDTLGFNSYWYSNHILENLSRNSAPSFQVVEQGPVLSAIEVETKGAGSNSIRQYIEIIAGLERVNIKNTVDKIKVIENENVRFSYPFDIPGGDVRLDIPWSVLEPGKNQLKGANLNFYSVQRFVDVSNDDYGITMTTVDAPIWEIGKMSGQHWMSDMKRRPWIKTFEPSQNLYAWVMNNAWFVNYKAYQEGEIIYRYSLIPHGTYSAAEAKKRGMEATMPLLLSYKSDQSSLPFVLKGSSEVIATSLKSSQDGKAFMLRLFNCSDQANSIALEMNGNNLYESSPLEETGQVLNGKIQLDPWEIYTIKGVAE